MMKDIETDLISLFYKKKFIHNNILIKKGQNISQTLVTYGKINYV